MLTTSGPRSGGEILIDTLKIHGVDTVFCLPGESFLAAIDALAGAGNPIRTIVTRHEAGAAHMAEAYGKPHCLTKDVTGELTVRIGAAIPNRIGV
ncbi:thiamine pyrophosphate-binding protein, partial [Bradyrhizobium sp. 31Argb]|uniref:thiamine pyrophosphate-binding protein n=1 Tax=Bradyrhizobium sp. 31Argb TaxID=3141247 RepID=UPI00374A7E28